jgi:hypothetical protein
LIIISGYVTLILRWTTSFHTDWKQNALMSIKENENRIPEIQADIFSDDLKTTFKNILLSLYNWIVRMVKNTDKYFIVFIFYLIFGVSWSCGYINLELYNL